MSEYTDYLLEQLHSLGPVACRRMFGGYGLFLDELMFAIVADDMLYLKTDSENKPAFEERGLEPFIYFKQDKPVALSYHLAPEEALEDPELLTAWARDACGAARRSAAQKRRRRSGGTRRAKGRRTS